LAKALASGFKALYRPENEALSWGARLWFQVELKIGIYVGVVNAAEVGRKKRSRETTRLASVFAACAGKGDVRKTEGTT
jgi:hypothetical protein